MLRSIQKLIGDKRKQLIFPIFLMSLDAIGSLVMYLMLYSTVIHLLNGYGKIFECPCRTSISFWDIQISW